MARPIFLLFAAAVAGSCAVDASRFDRAAVSAGIEAGTGFPLGPASPGGGASWPPDVALADGLSEEEAVAIALWNNPRFHEALADLGLARADLIEAGLLRNPVFSLLFPLGPKQLEATAKLPIEALWLAPRRVRFASLEGERVASRLVQHGLDLVRDVKLAYADSLVATERLELAQQAVEAQNQVAALVQRRRDGGDATAFDAALADTDARLAGEAVEERKHAVVRSHQRLRALLGLGTAGEEFALAERLAPPAGIGDPGTQELIAGALAARPELRAAELSLQAAEERAELAGAALFPVSLTGDANAKGTKGFEAGPGLEVAIPLFDRNQGAKARAAAEREKALLHLEAVRHAISSEALESWTQWVHAGQQLARFDEGIMPGVTRTGALARAGFEAGETTLLPVLEATARSVDARDRRAGLVAALRRAKAGLERSVGRRLAGGPPPVPAGKDRP